MIYVIYHDINDIYINVYLYILLDILVNIRYILSFINKFHSCIGRYNVFSGHRLILQDVEEQPAILCECRYPYLRRMHIWVSYNRYV